MVGPVLVTVEAPKTPKLAATPKDGAVANKGRAQMLPIAVESNVAMTNQVIIPYLNFCIATILANRPFSCPAKKRLV